MDNLVQEDSSLLNKVEQLLSKIEDNHKKMMVLVLSIVTLSLLLFCMVPTFQTSIRENQVNNLLIDTITDGHKFKAIAPDDLTKLIAANKDVNILFVDPKDKQTDAISNIVYNDRDKEMMKETVYVYPIIYNQKEIISFFKLSKGATLLHFDNKKETYRVNFESSEEIEFHFFDYLEDISNKD